MASGITVRALVLSRFALDGGAMHGIVPRTLWERVHAADDKHRIALVARALLVEHAPSSSRTLIELGMGQRWSPKERAIYALAEGDDVPEVLRSAGIDPESVTHVVLTHLHWDHAGGLVRRDGPHLELSLPRAEYVVGKACLVHALHPDEKDRGSFRKEDIELLVRKARVRAWGPADELAPGIDARLSKGHTDGLVVPIVRERDDGPPIAFPTDLVPTRSHLKPHWVAAYDAMPAVSVDEKRALFADLFDIGGGVVLYHDPLVEAAWTTGTRERPELVPGTLDGTRTPIPVSRAAP